MVASKNSNALYFFKGGGELGALMRETDWTKTPLGPPEFWANSLTNTVATLLHNPFAMSIAWGEEYTQLYNDAFRPILGAIKHPQALGMSSKAIFAETWKTIGPIFSKVMIGDSVRVTEQMVPLSRNGFVEECYFDFAYSPVFNNDGTVGGILTIVIEITKEKKALIALTESEARFRKIAVSSDVSDRLNFLNKVKESEQDLRSMVLQAPIGICVLDANTLVSEIVNDSFVEVAGKRYDEIAGRHYWDTFVEAKPYYEAASITISSCFNL